MPLIHCDGFDNYTDASLKWTVTTTFASGIEATAGRDGRGAWKGDAAKLTKTITAAPSIIVGFAFKSVDADNLPILAIGNGSTDLVYLRYDPPEFQLTHAQTNAVLGTSSGADITANKWCYLELKFKVSSSISSGDVVLRVNTVPQITVAGGTSTTHAGATTFTTITIGSLSGALNHFAAYLDDVVILSTDEGFWGDVVVEGKRVSGAGNYAQWTPTGDTPNYKCVDEANPDGDTTYNKSNTVGARDSFVFGPMNQSVLTVRGVQISMDGKSESSNPVGVTPFFRQGGSDYDQSRTGLTTSYDMYLSRYQLNPATGNPWTPEEIAALEVGLKLTT